MNVLVSGSTGLVGRSLVPYLRTNGHTVTHLVRRPAIAGQDELEWDVAGGRIELHHQPPFDTVVHLAGESIAQGRWTPTKKRVRLF